MNRKSGNKSNRETKPNRLARRRKYFFESWDDISKYMRDNLIPHVRNALRAGRRAKRVLFRGTTDATHKLVPTIGRKEARAQKWKYDPDDEEALLHAFEIQARPYLRHAPANKLEWLAVARHHGVPTRLLDWTTSFLTALFFAVENGGRKQVEAITKDAKGKEIRKTESKLVPPAIYETRDVRYCDPASTNPFTVKGLSFFIPSHISPYIAAQQSILAIHPDPNKEPRYPRLKKMTINPEICVELKHILEGQGITHGSIFPTIGGLAQQLQWAYKWNLLDQYHLHVRRARQAVRGAPRKRSKKRGQ